MKEKKELAASVASLGLAFLVASCCLGPLIFILTSVSVAGLSQLSVLSKYRPIF